MAGSFHHRLHNRLWNIVSNRVTDDRTGHFPASGPGAGSSVSSSMPWAQAAAAYADPARGSAGFRRLRAVRDVVETVGPVDGRSYARNIRLWDDSWFSHETVDAIDSWGTPIRWPALLLGTPRPFSPTTLRYLATALWLKREGFVSANMPVVELGVGFGGLAAMNAIVSGTSTTLVDLPQVEALAARMLQDLGLGGFHMAGSTQSASSRFCFVSNYAFSELSEETQDRYMHDWIRHASSGVIVSNAGVFSKTIGGRSDSEILAMLRNAGIPAEITDSCDLTSPMDRLSGVTLIHWRKP